MFPAYVIPYTIIHKLRFQITITYIMTNTYICMVNSGRYYVYHVARRRRRGNE